MQLPQTVGQGSERTTLRKNGLSNSKDLIGNQENRTSKNLEVVKWLFTFMSSKTFREGLLPRGAIFGVFNWKTSV